MNSGERHTFSYFFYASNGTNHIPFGDENNDAHLWLRFIACVCVDMSFSETLTRNWLESVYNAKCKKTKTTPHRRQKNRKIRAGKNTHTNTRCYFDRHGEWNVDKILHKSSTILLETRKFMYENATTFVHGLLYSIYVYIYNFFSRNVEEHV